MSYDNVAHWKRRLVRVPGRSLIRDFWFYVGPPGKRKRRSGQSGVEADELLVKGKSALAEAIRQHLRALRGDES